MSKKINTRKAKILIDDKWKDIEGIEIKKGMVFQMFEKDGTPVLWEGHGTFIATEDSFIRNDGIIVTPLEKFFN